MNKQKRTKVGQNDNLRSGTGFSQTKQRFSFMIVVVKDHSAEINVIFVVNHLFYTLIHSMKYLGKKIESN